MKRTGLFLVLAVLLAVGTVNAHDKGDLMVSPEFQPGGLFFLILAHPVFKM